MDERIDRFIEFLQMVAGDPGWGRLRETHEYCFANGHRPTSRASLTYLEDTPDRGRWVAKVRHSLRVLTRLFTPW